MANAEVYQVRKNSTEAMEKVGPNNTWDLGVNMGPNSVIKIHCGEGSHEDPIVEVIGDPNVITAKLHVGEDDLGIPVDLSTPTKVPCNSGLEISTKYYDDGVIIFNRDDETKSTK